MRSSSSREARTGTTSVLSCFPWDSFLSSLVFNFWSLYVLLNVPPSRALQLLPHLLLFPSQASSEQGPCDPSSWVFLWGPGRHFLREIVIIPLLTRLEVDGWTLHYHKPLWILNWNGGDQGVLLLSILEALLTTVLSEKLYGWERGRYTVRFLKDLYICWLLY